MNIIVEDVGRNKVSFILFDVEDYPDAMEAAILKGIRQRGALGSRIIHVITNEERTHGYITVGDGMRRVGRWRRG
jgi:hypothetical protein